MPARNRRISCTAALAPGLLIVAIAASHAEEDPYPSASWARGMLP